MSFANRHSLAPGRRHRSSEISSNEALAIKSRAEARQIDLNSIIESSETINEMGEIIHKKSVQHTIDQHKIIGLGWEKVDLKGKIKAAMAEIELLKEQLALARSKGFID